ncbi:MAG TPA: response regulator [Lachnospiraceae bacterium]|nr:response regulator [Lachnospiraceae bacterium]
MKYGIVVAEDEALLLENLIQKIEAADLGFEVIGSAQTGIQAYELVEELNPDVLITDIRMPAMDGLSLIQKINESHPRMDCIITSGYSDFEYARTALKYHVYDYLLKPVDIEELKTVLKKLDNKYTLEQNALEDIFRNTAESTPSEIAALLKEYIIQNFNEEINLNLIAHNMNYSSSYLTKIFCQYYDCTPSKYIISLRMQKAQQLLSHHTELSIRQIGEAVGYPEQGYFSRIFKKQTGVSPLDYRESKH